ncbi:MAG: hypothetical protein PVI35_07245, partial [Acidimicrobiia bacterium]
AAVKKAALKRERDWTPEERNEISCKYRALKAWVTADAGAAESANPAHGDGSDLPKISSQIAYGAVFDWLVDVAGVEPAHPEGDSLP